MMSCDIWYHIWYQIWHHGPRQRRRRGRRRSGCNAGASTCADSDIWLCQTTRKKGRAWWGPDVPRTMTDWDTQRRTSPVWMPWCVGRRGRAWPRRGGCSITVANFKHPALKPAECYCNSAPPRAFSKVGIDTLKSYMISYLIFLILYMKVCVLWYHWPMI